MARFTPTRPRFGTAPAEDDQDETTDRLPAPLRLKLLARRAAAIAEAKEIVRHIPEPGESVHVLISRRLELSDVLNMLIDTNGRANSVAIATLGFSRRSLKTLLGWLDGGKVETLQMIASEFFRAHNRNGLWQESQDEFKTRGQRIVCAPSHAKICVLRFASGVNLCTESSANLCSSGSGIETVTLIRNNEVCDFHQGWIEERIGRVA